MGWNHLLEKIVPFKCRSYFVVCWVLKLKKSIHPSIQRVWKKTSMMSGVFFWFVEPHVMCYNYFFLANKETLRIICTPGKLTCPLKLNGWFRCNSYWNMYSPFLGDEFYSFSCMSRKNVIYPSSTKKHLLDTRMVSLVQCVWNWLGPVWKAQSWWCKVVEFWGKLW